jgi:hypothetical protein
MADRATEPLNETEIEILRSLPVTVYSPGVATMMRYGPLATKGLVDNEDIGSDEGQETIWHIFVTPAGKAALAAAERSHD